ncbi:MAG: hypothetical protein ACI4WG_02165 [Erysipelotrichaceae bacterium]
MSNKDKLTQAIIENNFDEAKAVAFTLISTLDDCDSVEEVLNNTREYKDTVTYKIVEKMLKYM